MAAESSSSVRICLKSLALCTLDVMKDLRTTTSEDLATIIVNKFMRTQPNLTGQDTIRRRIYDVINVLSATGMIEKAGKQLVFRGYKAVPGGNFLSGQMGESDARIAAKEAVLREKISLLVLYKALIQRNFHRMTMNPGEEPKDAVHLPAIVVGIRNLEKSILIQPTSRELKIEASHKDLLFLAPSDILKKMRRVFSDNLIRSFLSVAPERGLPELSQYGSHLFEERQ